VHLAGEPGVEQHADAAHDDVGAAVHPGQVRFAVHRPDLGVEQGLARVRVDGAVDLAHEVARGGGRVAGGGGGALETGQGPAHAGVLTHQADQVVHGRADHDGVLGTHVQHEVAVAVVGVQVIGVE